MTRTAWAICRNLSCHSAIEEYGEGSSNQQSEEKKSPQSRGRECAFWILDHSSGRAGNVFTKRADIFQCFPSGA
jgi:hypothetical protein